MLKSLFSNRLFIGALAFFVLCVGGGTLYSWHVHRTTESDMARHDQFLQGINENETRPAETVNVPNTTETPNFVDTPEENTDTPMPNETEVVPNETETLDITEAFLPDDMVSEEEAPAEDVPVSPFGFGPYPEVPADYPNDMRPSWGKTGGNPSRDHELMHRVLIRLWNQGDKLVSGAFMDNGVVYPLYPNTAYVEYRDINMPDGTVRRIIKSADGPLGTTPIVTNGFSVLPDGVKGINKRDAGINPYDFLDLK